MIDLDFEHESLSKATLAAIIVKMYCLVGYFNELDGELYSINFKCIHDFLLYITQLIYLTKITDTSKY